MKTLATVLILAYALTTLPGNPWNEKVQHIPGRIQCEFYDIGGEGKAYHDTDSVNNGSGKLNPANGEYLHEFRMKEAVDISFTKAKGIDDNPYNNVNPELNQLYVGWTQPGEWINYTLQVDKSGTYTIKLMYTANRDGVIALDLDGQPLATQLKIPSTYNEQDTIAWRQWHHWNRLDKLASVTLKKGMHVLTLRTIEQGNMNYDYLEFERQ